jgi:rubredoxin
LSRNKNRLGGHEPQNTGSPAAFNPLNFVAPTEFVELPSQGKAYPEGHPLYDQDTIEIRYMTAKDEDILTSQTLLKKGVALDRFLENIVLDKSIDLNTILVGDKNAILVAARASGYGFEYDTTLTCPQCSTKTNVVFDLRNPTVSGILDSNQDIVTEVSRGVYSTTMPLSKFNVSFRLMNSEDENVLSKAIREKNLGDENVLTGQFKRIIMSIEDYTEQNIIDQYVENMPTVDSRHFKMCIKACNPNIEIKENFKCRNCSFEQEVDVPFGTDFFWPDL